MIARNSRLQFLSATALALSINSCRCTNEPTLRPAMNQPSVKPTIQPTTTVATPTARATTTTKLQLTCLSGGVQEAKEKTNEARNAYLGLFGQKLANGTIILKRPDNDAVSEGIGFGGLIFSQTPQSFLEINRGRRAYFLNDNGVMAWRVDNQGRKIGQESASDGDQDWIAAEIAAAGNSQQQIQNDLSAFWRNHVKEVNGRLFFLATNGDWARRGDGREVYYPSYPDPHFLRSFAVYDQTHKWQQLANDVQALNQAILNNQSQLGANGQNPMPAKVFVKVRGDGAYTVENYYSISRREGVKEANLKDNELDSIRFFLRMGRAALLDNDQTAAQILNQIITAANINEPASAHLMAKTPGAPSPLGYNNTLARASYGLAMLGSGETAKAEDFFCSVFRDHKGSYFGEWDGAKNSYYDQSLIIQIMDLAINQ